MTGKKVAVAVDGVVIDWLQGLKSHVAARLRVPPKQLAMNVSWNLSEWGIDNPLPYLRGFLASDMAGRAHPIPGAEEGLASLRSAGFEVKAVTRRQHMVGDDPDDKARAREVTVQWFAERPELGVLPEDLVFAGDPVSVEADVWIDNSPGRVQRLVNEGRPVWLLPQPWNRGVQTLPGVSLLFDGWASIGDLIEAQGS